ncbi:MAG: DUF1844 domain-containing protein [Deltaproteobacteria bacterium]|nr:DUF1844 domain-containing protein [Deltaproteobacteria bacterium]
MNQNEKDSIKVNDHRSFNPDGTERFDPSDIQTEARNQWGSTQEEIPSSKGSSAFPPVNFANFVLSLASSVQMCLGLSPNPFTGKVEKDLPQAKHSLDLMGMIQEKTKGNLTQEEDQLLQVILTDLRLRYIGEKKT